jgi:hypothetical protein
MKQAAASRDFLFGLLLNSEDGGDVFLETSIDLTRLHCVISKKTELFTVAAVGSSNT